MYRKKLMRVCLTGVMVVSIATANVAPVFAAEPVEKVETESDSWDSISGEINFRDTFYQFISFWKIFFHSFCRQYFICIFRIITQR